MYTAYCIAIVLLSVFSCDASLTAKKAVIPSPIFVNQSNVVKITDQTWAHVAVTSKSNVWAVHINKRVFFYNGTSLKSVNGTMETLSAGVDGSVWGLGGSSGDGGWEVYRRMGRSVECPDGDSWEKQPSSLRLTSIAVIKDNNVWGVKNFQTPMHWNGSEWKQVSQQKGITIGEVFVGTPGVVVGLEKADLQDVRKNKRLFVRDGITADDPVGTGWKLLHTKPVTSVAINDFTTVWAVVVDDHKDVSRLLYWDGKGWKKFADNIQEVSVGSDGAVWMIGKDESVFRLKDLSSIASASLLGLVAPATDHVEKQSIKPNAQEAPPSTVPAMPTMPTPPVMTTMPIMPTPPPMTTMPMMPTLPPMQAPAPNIPAAATHGEHRNAQMNQGVTPNFGSRAHRSHHANQTAVPGAQFIGQPIMPLVETTPQDIQSAQPLLPQALPAQPLPLVQPSQPLPQLPTTLPAMPPMPPMK